MSELFATAPVLLMSIVVGYLVGALPLADQISRRHGVDIFSCGTCLAGASNVFKCVGRFPALMVLIGDISKGSLTVILASAIGVEGPWVLLAAAAAVVGHWWSIFSGLRGGDGLATLGGVALALFGVVGLISIGVATVIALGGQRMPYSSLLSIVSGYGTLVALTVAFHGDLALAFGFGGLSGLVLAYALNGHRRRRHSADEWEDVRESEGAAEQSG